MRKQTKFAAVLSAAALLAMGASMTSFAAWEEEGGTWVWLDSQGERVTETWKKSGNQYFWLDENGEMATSQLVEDGSNKYYVDENGARVVNQWVMVDNEDDECEQEVDVLYYYFGSTGKAYTAGNKTVKNVVIEGKRYLFDVDGHMLSGWQNDDDGNLYYLGEENEGWAYTGWNYLEPDEDVADSGEYDDEEWFYFRTASGKAYVKARPFIDGAYYAFDANGVMDDKWVKGTPWSAATDSLAIGTDGQANQSYYTEAVGNQVMGWNYYYDNNDEEGDKKWFYMVGSNKGVPFNFNANYAYKKTDSVLTKYVAGVQESDNDTKAPSGSDAETNKYAIHVQTAAKVIKGKTYLFDATGKMMTGVYRVESDITDTTDKGNWDNEESASKLTQGAPANGIAREGGSGYLKAGEIYYFNKSSGSTEGQMMTGKQTVTYDGDSYYYYFNKSTGTAYTNAIVDGSVYDKDGIRVNATDGNSYEVVELKAGDRFGGADLADKAGTKLVDTGKRIIVSSSGKIKKSGTVTIDGYKYVVSGYVIDETKTLEANK